jgi:hypothetical protein
MAMIIDKSLRKGKNVIANFQINEGSFDTFKRRQAKKKHPKTLGDFIYCPNNYWLNSSYLPYVDEKGTLHQPPKDKFSYLDGLYNYALQFHKRNFKGQIIEGQTILVLDECQELFNPRSWNRKDRLAWCSFFREHRKYGFEVYLISQDDNVVDKQIRSILQYEYMHRCVNNYKLFGRFLGFMMGGKLFICIKKMYGVKSKDAKVKTTFFTGQWKYYNFYDSYATFARETGGDSRTVNRADVPGVAGGN